MATPADPKNVVSDGAVQRVIQVGPTGIDTSGQAWVWNAGSLTWVRMGQPIIDAGNVTISAISVTSLPTTSVGFLPTVNVGLMPSVNIGNIPAVTQSGAWNVTATVNIGAAIPAGTNLIGAFTGSVNIGNAPTVSVGNIPAVTQSGAWNVTATTNLGAAIPAGTNIIGAFTGSVNIGNAPTVSVGNIPAVTQSGAWNVTATTNLGAAIPAGTNLIGAFTGSVNIGNAPTVNIGLMPNVVIFSGTRSDSYTTPGTGTVVTATVNPFKGYAMQVSGVGGNPLAWDMRLEGSLDGSYFSQLLLHTTSTGINEVLWSGTLWSPALYIRSRSAGLMLGTATSVLVTILGVQ